MQFDRLECQEKALLVQVDFSRCHDMDRFEEFRNLALSAGLHPVCTIRGSRSVPDAKYFVGSGKAEEIREAVNLYQVDVVLFNHDLTPAQQRNLERLISKRVIDRTELILDIFAQRARTFEGKLQVELAQLQHLSTRLVRGWTHLERQKGGIGLRGPGETQLETDRRLVRVRIKTILKRLDKVRKQRKQARQKRIRGTVPTVSLVGYTNAGKTTLFNRLTESHEYTADQLFATLDPTLRKLTFDSLGNIILADTVGFVQDLPHDLIEAFQATLEETRNADLLIHVVDSQNESKSDHISAVNEVLEQIGANEVPQLLVCNKIDLSERREPTMERDQDGRLIQVGVSAKTGEGLDLLCKAISECVFNKKVRCCVRLSSKEGSVRSRLYDLRAIIQEESTEEGDYLVEIELASVVYQELFS